MIMCNGSESMPELTGTYHSSVLLILENHEDSGKDNEEVGMQEGSKLISNPINKLSDFVNTDARAMTITAMTTDQFCQSIKSGNGGEKWWQ
jgi:hypothetical protein